MCEITNLFYPSTGLRKVLLLIVSLPSFCIHYQSKLVFYFKLCQIWSLFVKKYKNISKRENVNLKNQASRAGINTSLAGSCGVARFQPSKPISMGFPHRSGSFCLFAGLFATQTVEVAICCRVQCRGPRCLPRGERLILLHHLQVCSLSSGRLWVQRVTACHSLAAFG